ncbi:MAG: hypothetical protein RLZZ69_3862, partial [Cyanobacteriota bacterium]
MSGDVPAEDKKEGRPRQELMEERLTEVRLWLKELP